MHIIWKESEKEDLLLTETIDDVVLGPKINDHDFFSTFSKRYKFNPYPKKKKSTSNLHFPNDLPNESNNFQRNSRPISCPAKCGDRVEQAVLGAIKL